MANERYSEVHPENSKASGSFKLPGEKPSNKQPSVKDTEAPTRDSLKKLPKVKGKE